MSSPSSSAISVAFEDKSGKKFLNYTTYFLTRDLVVVLIWPARIVKCSNGRIGISNIQGDDQIKLDEYVDAVQRALPIRTHVKRFWEQDIAFFKGDNFSLFNEKKEIIKEMPKVSNCRVAFTIKGVKIDKDGSASLMVDICQLMLEDVSAIQFGDACLF